MGAKKSDNDIKSGNTYFANVQIDVQMCKFVIGD
jgi:hypothetical protein